jgi:parvulin-like peptidyl-prolyl isomerase
VTTRLHLAVLVLLSSLPQLSHADAPKPIEETYAYVTRENGQQAKVPLFGADARTEPAAKVGDEAIMVEDIARSLTLAHQSMSAETKAGKKDFTPVLDRMIQSRLLVQEARAMGIADLPEIQAGIAEYRESALQELLKSEVTKDAKPDPALVERQYRDATREWKIKSALFARLADANAVKAAVAKGKSFDDLVKQAIADKKAKGGGAAEFVPRDRMLPEVLAALGPMQKGQLSAPLKLPDGYALIHVEDIRYPEDPKARATAQAQALTEAKKSALKKYYDGLVKKYVKYEQAVLKKLNYDAKKPGLAALEKDQRVVARIQGGKPITVATLTEGMKEQFHHGIENAIKEKKADRLKLITLDVLVSKQIIPLEARARGLDQTPTYQKAVEEYTNSILFAHFVDKAVVPGIQISEDDIKKYYAEHKADFTLPPFYKLEALGFETTKDAQGALNKLRSGTDLKWLRANADNQLKEGAAELQLGGTTLSANGLPVPVKAQLEGAKKGDYRLYTSPRGQGYVISVLDVTPPSTQPLDEVRGQIRQRLLVERVTLAVKDWAAKVRQARPVKIYLTKIGS